MVVIWNPNASRAADSEHVLEQLRAQGDVHVVETSDAEAAEHAATRAAAEGASRIIAAGGDGTINTVINGIMKSNQRPILGVLPLGTANDWFSSLDLPDDIEAAIETALSADGTWTDLAELETTQQTRYFANIATGGNSHRVTESITDDMKQTWGALCYLRGSIGVLADLQTYRTTISFDGGAPQEFEAWNVMVANGKMSGGRLEVAPRAIVDDGYLDIVIIRDGTLIDIAKLTAQELLNTYIESDQVEYRQAKEIRIRSEPPLRFSIDGDIIDEQPIVFRNRARALRVARG
ncbi:MAG: diacylglycerol kinase family lipid kinase [Planctomycetales bacterium]|nr:diacylglycerol kinase family lipid kinase [Planctomycetales bacterium]